MGAQLQSLWALASAYAPLVAVLAALVAGLAFAPAPTLAVLRRLLGTRAGWALIVIALLGFLWWRDHHAQYAAGLSAGHAAAKRASLVASARSTEQALDAYIDLSQRFAAIAETGETRVREAADLAAGRVAADVAAGRLRLRPIWQLPTPAAIAADPGASARALDAREGSARRIVGIGARGDARFEECVALLKAEREEARP